MTVCKQVPEKTISDECRWCGESAPEWSEDAQCYIHRRPRIDKRCTRKRLSPSGELVGCAIGVSTPEIDALIRQARYMKEQP